MQFDPENPINKLCAKGMMLEGEGKPEQALILFEQAWNEAKKIQRGLQPRIMLRAGRVQLQVN